MTATVKKKETKKRGRNKKNIQLLEKFLKKNDNVKPNK
jgi:hypothetical protein